MAFCFLALFLASSVSTLKVDDIKTKNNIIVVYGYPQNKTENVLQIVEGIGRTLRIKHPLKQVLKAYRSEVPKALTVRWPKPIVIHLLNEDVKIDWVFEHQERLRQRLHNDVWWLINGLTQETWILKGETDMWTKEKNYTWSWKTGKNKVWYMKNLTSNHHRVVDMEHLHYLRTNESHYEITKKPEMNDSLGQSIMEPFYDKKVRKKAYRPRKRKISKTFDQGSEGVLTPIRLDEIKTRRPYRRRKPKTDKTIDQNQSTEGLLTPIQLDEMKTRRPYRPRKPKTDKTFDYRSIMGDYGDYGPYQ
uniref:Uncharacterized protein n=1 Tax=Cacopsylla melanoneura TaxID=428564 RepID=A0A8D9BCG2_9HEMI